MLTGDGKRAVVLVSGGLDSATVLAIAKSEGYRLFAMTFDYQQRHSIELEAARRVVDTMGVERHVVFPIDLRSFGGSALTHEVAVPKDRTEAEMESGIPITYVPVRNTIFLSLAAAWAETLGAFDLFIGVNAIDYSGYPDCRPEFIDAFNTVLTLGTKAGVDGTGDWKIHAPLIAFRKAEIIAEGVRLGVDYSLTHSCYDPGEAGRPCGRCDSCRLRLQGFRDAGLTDPVEYCSS